MSSDVSNYDNLPSTSDEVADSEIIRSDMWFDDGNIVLQAENTQFCVHRGVLAKQSVVFRDMFSLPQGSQSTSDTVQGKPVVRMWDTAEDMSHLLTVLYDPACDLSTRHFDEKYGRLLCATLRLSTKYMIGPLRATVAKAFRTEYPSTLAGMEKLLDQHRDIRLAAVSTYANPAEAPDPANDVFFFSFDFEVANVCEETGLLSPLPSALFRCALRPVSEICDSQLSPTNKRRVLKGREEMYRGDNAAMEPHFAAASVAEACSTRAMCGTGLLEHMLIWAQNMPSELFNCLSREWRTYDSSEDEYPLCAPCRKGIDQWWATYRLDGMKRIPIHFGFESWEAVAEKDAQYSSGAE